MGEKCFFVLEGIDPSCDTPALSVISRLVQPSDYHVDIHNSLS